MSVDERIQRAKELYERAVFGGDSSGLATAERELNAVEADLALARGRILHARFLDERTIAAAQNRRDDALALLDEAATNAKASDAVAILRQVEEARSNI
jgi:hypothetical protein